MYYELGQIEQQETLVDTPTGSRKLSLWDKAKSQDFITYVTFGGIGLFLLGNLGLVIAKGKEERKRLENFGKTMAVAGILLRGYGEYSKLKATQESRA